MKLAESLPQVISEAEKGALRMELNDYTTTLAPLFEDFKSHKNGEKAIDVDWWGKVLNEGNRFPTLGKLVKSVLSVFTGPLVEGTFNMGIPKEDCQQQLQSWDQNRQHCHPQGQ